MKSVVVPALALVVLPSLAHAQAEAQVTATVTINGQAGAQQQPPPPPPPPGQPAVYGQPYGYQPQPQPVYGTPQPVYVSPQPVYVGRPMRGRRYTQVYDYNGGPIPPGATLRTGRLTGLYVPGIAIFAVTFVINEAVGLFCAITDADGYHTCAPGMGWLSVPVAGPWLALGTNTGPRASGDTDLLILDGVIHTAGFAMMLLGLVITHQVVVVHGYADAEEPRRPARNRPQWAVAPLAAPGTIGLGLAVTNF